MNIGDKIRLKGKTRKGKNKIHEQGNTWIIADARDAVVCLNGPGFLIESTGGDKRWIKTINDEDFEIISTVVSIPC